MSFEQQVMSRRSFIYTSGPQWVVILSEGEFLFSLANMATSGSQFSHPLGIGAGGRIALEGSLCVSFISKSCHVGRSSTLLVHDGL